MLHPIGESNMSPERAGNQGKKLLFPALVYLITLGFESNNSGPAFSCPARAVLKTYPGM